MRDDWTLFGYDTSAYVRILNLSTSFRSTSTKGQRETHPKVSTYVGYQANEITVSKVCQHLQRNNKCVARSAVNSILYSSKNITQKVSVDEAET